MSVTLAAVAYVLLTLAFGFSESKAGQWVLAIGWTTVTVFAAGLGLWIAVGGSV